MRDRQIQIAVCMCHQAEQMQRIGLPRPRGKHALREHFGLVGLAGIPVRIGFRQCFLNVHAARRGWGTGHGAIP
ncbi:hypothetical protein [Paraburkholderia tropica]|uniref:hypothetical protein n=1 Tax=Paraburkholderia tropica TaxID=92647 RepID=UPI0038BA438D